MHQGPTGELVESGEAAAAAGLPRAPRSGQPARLERCAGLACRKARGVGRRAGSALGGESGGRVRGARGCRCHAGRARDRRRGRPGLCPGRGGRRGGTTARRFGARHTPDRLADARAGGCRAREGVADDQLDRGDPGQSNHNPHRHCGGQAKPASPTRLALQRRRRRQLGPSISIVRTGDQPAVRTAGGPRRLGLAHRPHRAQLHRRPVQGLRRPRYPPSPPPTPRRRPRACPARPGTTRPEPRSRRPVSYPPPAGGVDRHAICTRRRRRRCGCGASCDARAGVMISGTASGRESRPSRSSRNPQAAAAPLPLLDDSRLRCGSACPPRSSSPGVMGARIPPQRGQRPLVGVADRVQAHVVAAQRKLSTLLPHGPDVIVCTVSGGQQEAQPQNQPPRGRRGRRLLGRTRTRPRTTRHRHSKPVRARFDARAGSSAPCAGPHRTQSAPRGDPRCKASERCHRDRGQPAP